MHIRSIRLLALVLVLVICVLSSQRSSADDAPADDGKSMKHLSVVLLGDSYSAGNGAGHYEYGDVDRASGEDFSYRSRDNWANNYRRLLLQQGISVQVTNLAHSGYVIEDIDRMARNSIPPDVDIVMLTAGGNDVNFGDVVKQCFAVGLRDAAGCRDAIEIARDMIADPSKDGMGARTRQLFTIIETRLRELGRQDIDIVLVGYPNLVLPDSDVNYTIHGCLEWDGLNCKNYTEYPAGAEVLRVAREMADMQAKAVADWNRNRPLTGQSRRTPATSTTYQRSSNGTSPTPTQAGRTLNVGSTSSSRLQPITENTDTNESCPPWILMIGTTPT